ncbi:MAG TPA: iron-containing alcohol dehydrogenase [Ktedonobacteraceae bacterium]|nr:iron-containing alcohol dehydrogenase [Ktedonobacteraceae bacterium]
MPAFPIDPGNITNMKHWLATQRTDHAHPLRPIEIAEILLGADVLPQLPSVLQRAGVAESATIVLVMDTVAMRRGEQELKPFVQALLRDAGYTIEPLWLEGDQYGLVHADFAQVQRVRTALRPGIALVALGSGTVTDIAKHAAYLYDQEHQAQQPMVYICCQTANSVTAFAANMAVLLKDGVKRTLPSRYPTAIISDLRVLASAPKAMTLAGLGDCCARFVAYGDWYLANALGLVEFYSEVPLALLANLEAILTAHAVAIGQRTYEGEAVVARALLLAGIAQSIVNMSAPISGTEHVISHVLDMIADHYQHGLALHGAQVGVATLTTSHLYQHFLNTFDPRTLNLDTCYPSDTAMQTHIQHLFANIDPNGTMAQECWSDYATKLTLWRQNRPHLAQFCARWQDEHQPKLASLVSSPDKVHAILAQAGAPLTPNDLKPPISQEEYNFAVRNGHFIRQRFVLGDLLYFLGWEI